MRIRIQYFKYGSAEQGTLLKNPMAVFIFIPVPTLLWVETVYLGKY